MTFDGQHACSLDGGGTCFLSARRIEDFRMSPQNAETPGSQVWPQPDNRAAASHPPATSVHSGIVGSALLPADYERQFDAPADLSGPSPAAAIHVGSALLPGREGWSVLGGEGCVESELFNNSTIGGRPQRLQHTSGRPTRSKREDAAWYPNLELLQACRPVLERLLQPRTSFDESPQSDDPRWLKDRQAIALRAFSFRIPRGFTCKPK